MATETIKYKVLHKDQAIEIRQYDDILLASTKTDASNYLDSGFNRVFNYISGQNEANAKISMTSPVVTYQEDDQLVTGFYVPSKYDKTTVPKPKGDVYINTIEPAIYAVITFNGSWTSDNFEKNNQMLLDYIHEHHYQIKSNPFMMRYNAPYVPSELKRNEVAYQIENYK